MNHSELNRVVRILLIQVISILVIACSADSINCQQDFEAVDQLFEKYHSSPGYALGYITDGKLIYSKGYGLANLDYAIPMTDTAAFYIGSMAKQFTAAALLMLESEGKTTWIIQYKHTFRSFPNTIMKSQLITSFTTPVASERPTRFNSSKG